MSDDNVDRLEHDKTTMYLNHNNRRMFLAVVIICITFIIVIALNSIRQERWINAFLKVIPAVTTEVQDGTAQQSRDP